MNFLEHEESCADVVSPARVWCTYQAELLFVHCSILRFVLFVLGGSSDGAKLKLYAQVFKHTLGK